jgi:hypothetical protein
MKYISRLASTWLSCGLALSTITPLQAELSQEAFRTPPVQARPSALWSWLNGYVDHKQITRELEEMKANGMRGVIIWDVGSISDPNKMIPAGPEFLGPESLKSIHHAMDEAERLGLELGCLPPAVGMPVGLGSRQKTAARHCFIANCKSKVLVIFPTSCHSLKKSRILIRTSR